MPLLLAVASPHDRSARHPPPAWGNRVVSARGLRAVGLFQRPPQPLVPGSSGGIFAAALVYNGNDRRMRSDICIPAGTCIQWGQYGKGAVRMTETHGNGVIRISDDVVATIAGLAALETPGIAGMSGGISEGLAKRLSGKNVQKGVSVEVGELEAAIDLRVIVHYGSKIQEVCQALQENVREAVSNMTGLEVVEVNVKVEGVAFKEEEAEEQHRVR
jgi:uncharacterized alkaline shock family protein YloU